MSEERCQGTNSEGLPCRSTIVSEGWCVHHHPDKGDFRQELREKAAAGSRAAHEARGIQLSRLPLNDHDDAKRWFEEIAIGVADGSLTHSQGASATKAVQAWIAAHDDQAHKELQEARRKLKEYREELARLRGKGRSGLRAS